MVASLGKAHPNLFAAFTQTANRALTMISPHLKKYVRICWNSGGWQKPTGEAAKLETNRSYAREFGFGHEEWLFDNLDLYENGASKNELFKYGYLQPIGKFRKAYVGKRLDLLLYTVSPRKDKLAVATLRNVFIPDDDEIAFICTQMHQSGEVERMQSSLSALDISAPSDFPIINIRFKPKDAEIFSPLIPIPKTSRVHSSNRYHPIDWNDDYFPEPFAKQLPEQIPDISKRSEDVRTRCAIAGVQFTPLHVKIQNQIVDHLALLHGKSNVLYEHNSVDLVVKLGDGNTVFYELKVLPSARQCIREALGQLLEYCHYKTPGSATKLIIVGESVAQGSDRSYLSELRIRYNLPIYYQRWDREANKFDDEV